MSFVQIIARLDFLLNSVEERVHEDLDVEILEEVFVCE